MLANSHLSNIYGTEFKNKQVSFRVSNFKYRFAKKRFLSYEWSNRMRIETDETSKRFQELP